MAHAEIVFQTDIERVNGVLLLRLSDEISSALPSRGMVMVEGLFKGLPFAAPAEPDGRGGHFIIVSAKQAERLALKPGDHAGLILSPAKKWPEPDVPAGFLEILAQNNLIDRWQSCTVRGRWEWLRWLRATNSSETRQNRMLAACDKLRKGEKRPCCFNSAACTVMEVCKSGMLAESKPTDHSGSY